MDILLAVIRSAASLRTGGLYDPGMTAGSGRLFAEKMHD
jgi:hypothetical protein